MLQGKGRKAYTMTKPRERWTDAEHAKFLEALKLYGREWRKIEREAHDLWIFEFHQPWFCCDFVAELCHELLYFAGQNILARKHPSRSGAMHRNSSPSSSGGSRKLVNRPCPPPPPPPPPAPPPKKGKRKRKSTPPCRALCCHAAPMCLQVNSFWGKGQGGSGRLCLRSPHAAGPTPQRIT